jgi:site-specific recombinase XerD
VEIGKAKFYQALKTLMLWLFNNNHIEEKGIGKIPAPKIQRKLLPAISVEQTESLLNHCRFDRHQALIIFLWYFRHKAQ